MAIKLENNKSINRAPDSAPRSFIQPIIQGVRVTLVLAALTGLVFPFLITLIGQSIFSYQANGSLLRDSAGKVIGSALIGQQFTRPEYFHPRPSAAGSGYAGESSSGTNLAQTSAKLFEGTADDAKTKNVDESFMGIKQLAEAYRKENGLANSSGVPVDAVTRSGSGLDPDISPANAQLQATRVAKARNLPLSDVLKTVNKYTQNRDFGFLGEPRVNVLLLNLALDHPR
jgi:potassium-transporting ATPase KdpC subunit